MTSAFPSPPGWLADPGIGRVIEQFRNGGEDIRFVGGCVRDALLGHSSLDIDLATTATPERSMALCDAAGLSSLPTGIKHGTITVMLDPYRLEITTLRTDASCDGRHAVVTFGSDWEADARRRDFTINALYADAEGALYDDVGGRDDLEHGVVRFIGDAQQRVREDYLRLLRFFRFWSRYGRAEVPSSVLEVMAQEAEGLAAISGERLVGEMRRLIVSPKADEAVRMMAAAGLFSPLAFTTIDVLRFRRWHQLRLKVALDEPPSLWLSGVAAMIAEDAQLTDLVKRWRLSRQEQQILTSVVNMGETAEPDDATIKSWLVEWGREMTRLGLLLALSHQEGDVSAQWQRLSPLLDQWDIPAFPLAGDDLISLGVQEGPMLGKLLHEVKQYWAIHDYAPDKQALLTKARQLAASSTLGSSNA